MVLRPGGFLIGKGRAQHERTESKQHTKLLKASSKDASQLQRVIGTWNREGSRPKHLQSLALTRVCVRLCAYDFAVRWLVRWLHQSHVRRKHWMTNDAVKERKVVRWLVQIGRLIRSNTSELV